MEKIQYSSIKSGYLFVAATSMKIVTLLFPDTTAMANFILKHHISKAEVNSLEQLLTAPLNYNELKIACTEYEAMVMDSETKISNKPLLE